MRPLIPKLPADPAFPHVVSRRTAPDGKSMHLVRTTLLTILVAALAGCGVIPGDAALRLGQPEKAAEFYRRGAEHGDGDSALRLGMLIDKRQVSASVYGSA